MADAAAAGFGALDPCVHCGLCLPACPTYLATGDEADSPRGRIVLMRALERGELAADDAGVREHLDRCLGCRGCEPACPSGVGYGRGLAAAREMLTRANGIPTFTRVVLAIFGNRMLWTLAFGAARVLRATGVAGLMPGPSRLGRLMGGIAATRGGARHPTWTPSASPPLRPTARVALFRGCIMDTLFSHVHDATRRTLQANGYEVVEVRGATCCGAPHEHAGDRAGAADLADANVRAFAVEADYIVVNSAGCGAMLRDYGHLLGTDAARAMAGKVRDVTELLAERGPRPGAPVPMDVAYDAPCHLQHAQGVHAAPLAVLRAVPGLRVHLLPGHDRCCGGAGAYALLEPELSGQVLADKVATLRGADPKPAAVATGNPGCIIQIGGGLRAAGVTTPVLHPVELLDRSYRDAGLYR